VNPPPLFHFKKDRYQFGKVFKGAIMNFTYLCARVLVPLAWAIAATVVPVSGQTWTTTLSGESSYNLAFVDGNTQPRTLTSSLQSPAMPTTAIGANDDINHRYPSGNASGTPPWWFIYTNNNFTATDLTNNFIYRNPTIGQISFPKSGTYGVRARAAFKGSGSGSGYGIESIYVGERDDWAGQREFGFFRNLSEPNTVRFYWEINANCSQTANAGYPYCRASQAPGNAETPGSVALFRDELFSAPFTGVNCSVQSMWVAYVFWASWDMSYKFRVEQWNSSYTVLVNAFNFDMTQYDAGIMSWINLGLTTSGMTGYMNLAATKANYTASNAQLVVGSVEYAH
jgi:hypothetical protein